MLSTNSKILACLAAVVSALSVAGTAQAQYQVSNPSEQQTAQWRQSGPCRDPWVTGAVLMLNGGTRMPAGYGDVGECDTRLYNGGQWSSFEQLVNAVYAAKQAMNANQVQWVAFVNPQRQRQVVLVDQRSNNAVLGGWLIGNDAGSAVPATAHQLVAAGAGNMVAAGAGNMVAAGAGNILPSGGGGYRTMSGTKRVIQLGSRSAIVIQ